MMRQIQTQDKSTGHVRHQWLATFICNTVIFASGLQQGWMSPNIRHLTSSSSPTGSPVSDNALAWIASGNSIGAIVAYPVLLYVVDRFGRKIGLIAVVIPQAICWILKLTSGSVAGLIIARVLSGMSTTCLFIGSVYIKEISQDHLRGILGGTPTVFLSLGVLIMYAIGGYVDYYTAIYIVGWIPFLSILLLLKAPESPEFLVKKGKDAKATSTLAWLRGVHENDKDVQNEIQTLQQQILSPGTDTPDVSLLSIMKNSAQRKGVLIILGIVVVQACSGYAIIINFALPLLEIAGATFKPELQALSVPALTIIGSFMSMATIEKLGRKALMIISSLLSAISLCSLATCLLLIDPSNTSQTNWWPLLFLALYMFGYSAGLMPLPAIIAAEMFNYQVRAKIISNLSILSWFLNFIQINVYASTAAGPSTSFFLFAAINLIGVSLAVVFLPETRGRSVDEIEDLLRKRALC